MITVYYPDDPTVEARENAERESLQNPNLDGFDVVRRAEIASIRAFLEMRSFFFRGRVLDYGCGKPGTCREPSPYRDLIDARGAEYHGYDLGDPAPVGPFDVVLCTQVLQFIHDPLDLLKLFYEWLKPHRKRKPGGILILTYPTNWDECEASDIWRFTQSGVRVMVDAAGFKVVEHERRAEVRLGVFAFALGYGLVAEAR